MRDPSLSDDPWRAIREMEGQTPQARQLQMEARPRRVRV